MYSIRIKDIDLSAASVGWERGILGTWQSQSTPNEAKHSQVIGKDHVVIGNGEWRRGWGETRFRIFLKMRINKWVAVANALYTCASLLAEGTIMLDVTPSDQPVHFGTKSHASG